MIGTIQHLLVLMKPDADPPWDPEGDALPTDEQAVWFSSMRRQNHPWIAQAGQGRTARADIAIGGQRLELPLGRSIDGEMQARVIDVAGPVTAVACDVDAVLIPEGSTDLHLDATAFSSGKWVTEGTYLNTASPWADWGANFDGPYLGTFALFSWGDAGPWVRSTWAKAVLDGTEGGGSPWTPGQIVGLRFRVTVSLDTGGGSAFVEVEGADGAHRLSGLSGPSFWTIPVDGSNNQVDSVIYAVADASGQVIVRLGGENMYPSFNLVVGFSDLEVVECADVVTGLEAERYVTANLADANARQQTLGWPYVYKQSFDQGLTWPVIAYRGFLKDSTMERTLTWLLTGGDSGKGRRVAPAWSELDPMEH